MKKAQRVIWCICLMCIAIVNSATVSAAKPEVTGWLERTHVEGIKPLLRAKLDSGALTSSIHGTNKVIFKRDGERWLRFDFHWHRKSRDVWYGPFTIEAPLVRKVLIKDHEDESAKRPVVLLDMSLSGKCHSVEFSVVDRTGFNYPVLLGRRFLAGNAIIDPRKTFTKASESRKKNICKQKKAAVKAASKSSSKESSKESVKASSETTSKTPSKTSSETKTQLKQETTNSEK